MTVRVVIVPTGGGQTVTGARATVELDDRSVTVAADPLVAPTTVVAHRSGGSIGGTSFTETSNSITAPSGTVEGMMLVAAFLGHTHIGNAAVGLVSATFPSEWQEIVTFPIQTSGQISLRYKWASAGDAAASGLKTTYAMTTTSGGGSTNHSHSAAIIGAASGFGPEGGNPFGTAVTVGASSSGATLSVARPTAGNGWTLAFAGSWTSNSGSSTSDITTFTSAGVDLYNTGWSTARALVGVFGVASGATVDSNHAAFHNRHRLVAVQVGA
jgi:hypothetical protein